MSKAQFLLIGVGAPFLLALASCILLKFGMFTDENSKALARVVLVGGFLSSVVLLVFLSIDWLLDRLSLILGVDREGDDK